MEDFSLQRAFQRFDRLRKLSVSEENITQFLQENKVYEVHKEAVKQLIAFYDND